MTKAFWTYLMIILMVFSVFGAIVGSMTPKNTLKYKEYKFTESQLGYSVRIDKQTYVLDSFPEYLEDIPVDERAIDILNNTRFVWFTYDPKQAIVADIAGVELTMINTFESWFEIYSNHGMTTENDYNISVITCRNATPTQPVIEFRETQNTTGIRLEGPGCIVMEADYGNNMIRLKDRVLYSMLGVMD